MRYFEQDEFINTNSQNKIKIIKYLASGGCRDIYVVDYQGEKKILVWYRKGYLRNLETEYEHINQLIERGVPGIGFLWPEALTEVIDNSFGYVVDILPEGYYELNKILVSSKYSFASYKAATEACIHIATAFRNMHQAGLCFGNIDDSLFLINPLTGDVIISCDFTEIALNGQRTGTMGKPRYLAPELVVEHCQVIANSDAERYSLSVILFLILCMGHPLEGKHWLVPCMTIDLEEKIYGSEPLFIYDPNDDANRPVKNIHVNVINRWGFMPQYLKDEFLTAFSQQALKEPNSRPKELDWLKVLVRFRSDIVKCSCGTEVFVQNAVTTKCDDCGKPIVINHTIKLPGYSITAAKGSRVYRCQLGACHADDALSPVALVVAKPDGTLGVKNMTQNFLNALTPSGKSKQIQPQEVIPFKPGIQIEAFDKTIELN